MPRATCRCGQPLTIPADGSDRVVCPKCGARVRIRRAEGGAPEVADGFLRFFCPCGRRLKVPADNPPAHGKCPDCGKIVPVPSSQPGPPPGHPDAPTEELNAVDVAALEKWARDHRTRATNSVPTQSGSTAEYASTHPPGRIEAGLRVCPRCGKPIHMGADACRACGTAVPRR